MSGKDKKLLKNIIAECEKHRSRMNFAYSKLISLIPLDHKQVQQLTEEQISKFDQYIFRFSKLQDALGRKLFKQVLIFLGEDIHDKPFLDIFHRLEQIGAIQSYEAWNTLRIMRNDIAHEYDEDPYLLAEKLNGILNSKEKLENYLDEIKAYLKQRNLNFD